MVSEKTAELPLFEAARTLPVTVPRGVKGLLLLPKFVGLTTWAPKSLPIKARSPARSKSREFGGTGMGFSGPVAFLAVERL